MFNTFAFFSAWQKGSLLKTNFWILIFIFFKEPLIPTSGN